MDSKAISGVIVAIFLTIISVGLAFGFLVFGRATQQTLEEDVGGGVERSIESLQGGVAIFEVKENTITVKNTGRNNIDASQISVLLDGKRARTNTTASVLAPGETAKLTVLDFVPGVYTVRLSGPGGALDEGDFAVAPPGIVALWDFEDEDSKPDDLVGSNHGSLNGSTMLLMHLDDGTGDKASDSSGYKVDGTLKNGARWSAGVSGNAVQLDGVDDFVEVPSVNPTKFITVEAWVKSGSSSGYSGVWQIVSKYSAYILGTSSADSNAMCFIIYTTTWQYGSCYAVPDPQNWHHFVGTYDSVRGEKKLYVNGVLRETTNPSGEINADAGPINLGKRECCSDMFNGTIDEVAIHSRVLTESEIKERYEARRAKFSDYRQALIDTGVHFDGKDDTLTTKDFMDLAASGDKITIEALVKRDSGQSGDAHTILSKWKNNGEQGWTFRFSNDKLNFAFTNPGGTYHQWNSDNTFTDTANFYHIAMTFTAGTGSSMKMYFDGTPVSGSWTTGTGDPLPIDTTWPVTIGAILDSSQNPVQEMNGTIDYVAVYNRVLSDSEIEAIADAANA